MTKLFKNSKHVLSFVLAFAVLAVSLFTGVVINSDAACVGETIYWSGYEGSETVDTINDAVNDVKQAGTAADPIIIDNAEELYVLVTKVGSASENVYYKVANGISKIILQPENTDAADVLDLANSQAVREHFEGNPSGRKAWSAAASGSEFRGNFDGNGVTICGMYSNSNPSGLFGRCLNNVTLSNFTIKNSYATSYNGGLVIGQNQASYQTYRTTLDKISIVNNCMIGWNNTSVAVGNMALIGMLSTKATASNLFVSGNIAQFEGPKGKDTENKVGPISLIKVGGWDGSAWFTNSIILDITPYATTGTYTDTKGTEATDDDTVYPNTQTFGYATGDNRAFANIYTNMSSVAEYSNKTVTYEADEIKQVDGADLQGSSAVVTITKNETDNSITNGFDWKNTWVYGFPGEYPTTITAAVASDEEVISCYSGTPATAFSDTAHDGSTAENAIVIATADEFAYLANGADGNTAGKYYAIDPSIDAMVLQSSDYADTIMALDSASEVKDYFENTAPSGAKINWATSASSTTCFAGTLNGNGATIYGMHSTANNQYGLFPYSYNITLENIAIKNSYVYGDKAGVIVGYAGSNAGTITFNNCEVANNVAIASRFNDGMSHGGVLIGYFQDSTWNNTFLTVDNCVIYGNSATHTESYTSGEVTATYDTNYGLYGVVKGSATDNVAVKISDSIILDTLPFVHDNVASKAFNYGTFENVYTNMLGQTFVNKNYNNGIKTYTLSSTVNDDGTVVISSRGESTKDRTLAAGSLISISAADVIGDNAKTNASALGWVDNGGVWYTGNAWGYPSFKKAGVMPTANQMAFDGLTMTNYDTYTAVDPEFSMYATSLNLKANPYIAFTFAFNGEYKTNRDDITVTFTNSSGTQIAQTTVGNGKGGVNAGWTNNAGAGRYHLYRLENVAVEDLCKPITVTVNYDGNNTVFGTFSVEGFALDIQNAYKQDPCDYYAVRVEAAKALLYYTQMINARYGSIA